MPETTPARPAPVSGPGQLARRTDGGPAQKLRDLPDAQYGEAQTFRDLQQAAPLAQTTVSGQASPASGSATGVTPPSVIPLDAPTTRPNEPITAGSMHGPGPGPGALGIAEGESDYSSARSTLQSIAAVSNSPEVQALLNSLNTRL